jgi:hypothetical protein
MIFKRFSISLLFLGAFFAVMDQPVLQAADKVSYDRYTTLSHGKPASTASKIAANFLTYPLELVRWPLEKNFYYFDEYHMLDKGKWLYERIADEGITPRLDGADVDLMRLSRLKTQVPNMIVSGGVSYWAGDYFELYGKAGFEQIAQTPLRFFQSVSYEDRPEEYFYGVGPDTSKGDATSYLMEATTVKTELGYSQNPSFGADVFFAYKNVNIGRGRASGRGQIEAIFPGQNIIGLDGDEIISLGGKMERETRDQKDNSTKGHNLNLGFSYNEGVDGSNARYLKYEAEAIKHCRLWSDRRVFVTRVYAEHNDEISGGEIPFHQMAKLGGYGTRHGRSNTLRGFGRNRFFDSTAALFNFEYRYTVYNYREWKMDTVLFWDEGQVFDEFSEFQLQDFRESYGIGFRVSLLNNVLMSLELAHGDEGTQFYVRSRSPF